MELVSPGYRSHLIFTGFDGLAADRGDCWAIHSLANPNFFWGNLLIFDRPPQRGDADAWIRRFKLEFTDPRIYHVTLAWQSARGEIGDVSEFLQRGYLLESTAVLTAREVRKPFRHNSDLVVRPLAGERDWEDMLAVQMAYAHSHISTANWENFYRTQAARYQAMERAGLGHWYGGFFEGRLVAGLGIFHQGVSGDGLGRFQTVSTHPEFQRRGFCQTLVYESSRLALASGRVQELVMCADPEYHAIRLYEAVGFQRCALEHGVYWWDKTREPK
jgi:ribosomal protein S18 acetylase RimI-like enzyme